MTPIPARAGQGPSVTEGWRAVDLSTDRLPPTRRFAAYLNDDPAPQSILYFCADVGTGKSLLLRSFLGERCTLRLPREAWNRLEALPDREFREQLVPGDARAHNIAGLAHLGCGRAEAARGQPEEATAALDRAMAAFEEAARHRPGSAYALCNAGTAWRTLGDLQARQGRDGEAHESFELAVAAFDEALGVSPDYARALARRSDTERGPTPPGP